MAQAAIGEGLALDPCALAQDRLAAAEGDVGRGEVAQALVSPSVVVVLDKGGNPRLQFADQHPVDEEAEAKALAYWAERDEPRIYRRHAFDWAREQTRIEHRLTKPAAHGRTVKSSG